MRYVKYVGLAHQRIISPSDWRSVGVNGSTVVWSARNGFAVPLDSFTEDQITKAIEPDENLVITGESEEFTPVSQTTDMTPSQAAQAAEAPVDVVGALNGVPSVSPALSGGSTTPGSLGVPAPVDTAPSGKGSAKA